MAVAVVQRCTAAITLDQTPRVVLSEDQKEEEIEKEIVIEKEEEKVS